METTSKTKSKAVEGMELALSMSSATNVTLTHDVWLQTLKFALHWVDDLKRGTSSNIIPLNKDC